MLESGTSSGIWKADNLDTAFGRFMSALLAHWPEHGRFLDTSLKARKAEAMVLAGSVADLLERLVALDADRLVRGYRWMCDMILEEEIQFRRTRRYRHSSFKDVDRLVYQDSSVMALYMDGLLLSQIIWNNHLQILEFYIEEFLNRNSPGGEHLEIGPGHGLLLYFASRGPDMGKLVSWDVSTTSLAHTRACLDRLGVTRPVELKMKNLFEEQSLEEKYDSIVISEVLEHLEEPSRALRILYGLTRNGGRIFVNAPINAPAIDHIFLFSHPDELIDMVGNAGFEIESVSIAPTSGYDIERAMKSRAAISCGIIGRRRREA